MFITMFVVTPDVPDPGAFMMLGAAVLMAYLTVGNRVNSPFKRGFLRVWAVLAGLASMGVIILTLVVGDRLPDAYARGDYEVVEGEVQVEADVIAAGSRVPKDIVVIAGRRLEIQPVGPIGKGYSRAASQGGLLQAGTRARLYVHDGQIVRVDIWREKASASKASRAA
jgi:hypothetical protein